VKSRLMPSMPIVSTAVILLTLLGGCGDGFPVTPTGAPETTATSVPTAEPTATALAQNDEPKPVVDDWELYTLEDDGIALSLPPSWEVLNLDRDVLTDSMRDLWEANPEVAKGMAEQATNVAVDGLVLYALDMDTASTEAGVQATLNIVRTPNMGFRDVDNFLTFAAAGVSQLYGKRLVDPVTRGRVTSASGHSMGRLEFGLSFNTPDARVLTMTTREYLLLKSDNIYVVTCAALKDETDAYADTCETIARGLYFLD
jgi:hypothetical protein